jgi:catabolite regulation protein CreA
MKKEENPPKVDLYLHFLAVSIKFGIFSLKKRGNLLIKKKLSFLFKVNKILHFIAQNRSTLL